jgi:predicted GIY-YIG superfamily endonuclease
MAFYVYILRCADGSYYTGHTEDLEGRLSIHRLGLYCGYTASRRPLRLMWSADLPARIEALEYERIKRWSRARRGPYGGRLALPQALSKEKSRC